MRKRVGFLSEGLSLTRRDRAVASVAPAEGGQAGSAGLQKARLFEVWCRMVVSALVGASWRSPVRQYTKARRPGPQDSGRVVNSLRELGLQLAERVDYSPARRGYVVAAKVEVRQLPGQRRGKQNLGRRIADVIAAQVELPQALQVPERARSLAPTSPSAVVAHSRSETRLPRCGERASTCRPMSPTRLPLRSR